MNSNPTYDEIPYPSHVFKDTQPDKLATVATLFGMQPPAVERCRVLELGCSYGNNLIAMAQAIPQGEFVGVDLSKRQIEEGRKNISALGLKNIRLEQQSILDIHPRFGQFDYIVAHGVYSWVPRKVQDKMLAICQHNLVRNGVAYISYNTYPGWHHQGMIRQMMLYHTQQFTDAKQRITQSRALLKFLVEANKDNDDYYSLSLRMRLEQLDQVSDAYIFHDYLEENNEPIFFYQFVERAKQHKLQYLAESVVGHMLASNFSPAVAQQLELFQDQIQQEQYTDFLRNRSFRQTLLCHQDISLNRTLHPNLVTQFYIAMSVIPVSPQPDLHEHVEEKFKSEQDEIFVCTSSAEAKSLFCCLSENWPVMVPFDQLMQQVEARLGNAGLTSLPIPTMRSSLSNLLLQLFAKGKAEFSVYPPKFVLTVNDSPIASPLSRLQAMQDSLVTNLRYESTAMDALTKYILPNLDGYFDRQNFIAKLVELAKEGKVTVTRNDNNQPITDLEELHQQLSVNVNDILQKLAQRCFLIA